MNVLSKQQAKKNTETAKTKAQGNSFSIYTYMLKSFDHIGQRHGNQMRVHPRSNLNHHHVDVVVHVRRHSGVALPGNEEEYRLILTATLAQIHSQPGKMDSQYGND